MKKTISELLGQEEDTVDPLVCPSQDPTFGDYQSNVAFGLAKLLKRKPVEIAREIAGHITPDAVYDPPEVAGSGYVNFRIKRTFLQDELRSIWKDPRLGIPVADLRQRIIVDFSSPNLAKEMHVGHLRSTIIGDTIARLLEFYGHDVLRLNHVGDWGTQFGMLIEFVKQDHDIKHAQAGAIRSREHFHLTSLEDFYRDAKRRFDTDSDFADAARQTVVDLQSGETAARSLWKLFCDESLQHCHDNYLRLGVKTLDRGESFYNAMLPDVVDDLMRDGIARDENGTICVFVDGWTNREGEPQPLIIRKSDGGYNYATTDLAAIRHRVTVEKADRIIYVTDNRQEQHFSMVFATARLAGWVPEGVTLDHVGFGMVLGADRRPFKTRDGGSVKLRDLLDEAETRARLSLSTGERKEHLSEEERTAIATAVGIGAVKYADLSHTLSTDYVFDWDTMLAMEGNTAPYMLYAYARIRSIIRRAGVDAVVTEDTPIILEHEAEAALARHLIEFPAVLDLAASSLRPSYLTDYLYRLSRVFTAFYDRDTGVRVVDAPTAELQTSRLILCELTSRTLKLGLGLLGIEVVDQM